jgi:hypothetical protein
MLTAWEKFRLLTLFRSKFMVRKATEERAKVANTELVGSSHGNFVKKNVKDIKTKQKLIWS